MDGKYIIVRKEDISQYGDDTHVDPSASVTICRLKGALKFRQSVSADLQSVLLSKDTLCNRIIVLDRIDIFAVPNTNLYSCINFVALCC